MTFNFICDLKRNFTVQSKSGTLRRIDILEYSCSIKVHNSVKIALNANSDNFEVTGCNILQFNSVYMQLQPFCIICYILKDVNMRLSQSCRQCTMNMFHLLFYFLFEFWHDEMTKTNKMGVH